MNTTLKKIFIALGIIFVVLLLVVLWQWWQQSQLLIEEPSEITAQELQIRLQNLSVVRDSLVIPQIDLNMF
ncbi:hypothetical protein IJJ27_01570 [bacterium]|nr:hypothetical protein [bacterium]MBQ6436233.1 hypothetical protein [bacterium]